MLFFCVRRRVKRLGPFLSDFWIDHTEIHDSKSPQFWTSPCRCCVLWRSNQAAGSPATAKDAGVPSFTFSKQR